MMFAALLMATVLVAEPAAIVDFDSQIVPMLTHAGCNDGACHGAAAGRSGFHLSLFGSDPQADYAAIVSFAEGRRINLVDVTKSLVLAKPLGMLDHGGGEVLEEDSTSVAVLRRWIGQGATRGAQRQLTDLRVDPAEAITAMPGESVAIRAIARFSDGEETDVTAWTVFRADDPTSVEILHGPLRARALRPGKHVIMARFWNRIVPVSVLLPHEARADAQHRVATSSSLVDSEIDAQLAKLNLVANQTADDATFLRRLRLDLTGRLPTPEELREFQSSGTAYSHPMR